MLFERPAAGRRALLLHVRFSQATETDLSDELRELAVSAGLEVCGLVTARRQTPHRRWFVGSGKLDEIEAEVRASGADLLVINHELSPSQQRNLETHLQCGVLTRTELILTIFADRARTHEGQLQVELAQCRHAQTRLVRGWTHLDRQKGGVGMRGAGETQIELDQRMLDDRIKGIQKKLIQVRKRRAQGRRARRRAETATIVLVGYTNAGKSTLFNALTAGGALAEDRLFATLDPTIRQLNVPGIGQVVLADTVGFIRDLPHTLVEAFKATLEEVKDADLLLLVVDGADEASSEREAQVLKVLKEIEAQSVPRLCVYNKADIAGVRAQGAEPASVSSASALSERRRWVSAYTSAGLPELIDAIGVALGREAAPVHICLTPAQGRLHAWLYGIGAVISEVSTDSGGWELLVQLDEQSRRRLAAEQIDLGEVSDRRSPISAPPIAEPGASEVDSITGVSPDDAVRSGRTIG